MFEPAGLAAILIAFITGGVTLWTQRGGARAQRRTAAIEERAQSLAEFQTYMDWATKDVTQLRVEVAALRDEVSTTRLEASQAATKLAVKTAVLAEASTHIRVLRDMVPPPGPPQLPNSLREHNIGI